jgi:fatty acid kinase fatty acid binding subunit
MPVAVITDSAASLPPELAAASGVAVVPMWITVGGSSYRDGELPLASVVERGGVDGVTTSGPSPGEFATTVGRVLGPDGAIVLTVAATMSGTNGAAHLAAELLGPAVRVVDTGTAAGAEGLVVLAAARAARAGASLAEVEQVAHHVADRVRLVATLEDLDTLARSGRVPGAAAWAGRWLGVNPIFEFQGGKARAMRPALSRPAALDRIVAACRSSQPRGGRLHVAGLHAVAPEPAVAMVSALTSRLTPVERFIGAFSPVMVAHTGPKLAGLAWWWEEEGGG